MSRIEVKSWPDYRATRGRFDVVDLPARHYLMIDGHGDPNTTAFADAVQTLYPVAYTAKFAAQRELGLDCVVPPLEGLWWAEDMDSFTTARDKSRWDWTLMILTPDDWPADLISAAIETVRVKKAPARLNDLRHERLAEGRCVQTLHIGPFDAEAEVLKILHHKEILGRGWSMTGRHHEIYLSDFRRVPEARRRTILRQPVSR